MSFLLVLLLKPAAEAEEGNPELFKKLLSQPYKHMRHGKPKKHKPEKQPTVDCSLKPIKLPGAKHNVGKII